MKHHRPRLLFLLAVLCLAVCLLAGCRHEGQDRIGLVHLRQDGFRIIQRFRE